MMWKWSTVCPNDAGVLSSSITYTDFDNYIGRINATTDPNEPLSANGNIGPAKRWEWSSEASLRLNYFNLPNAVVTATVGPVRF